MTASLHETPVTSRRQIDALPAAASEELSTALQRILVDLLELQAQAKQAHWNITGRDFSGLHRRLDEIAAAARAQADTFAERLRALGGTPDGTTDTVVRTTTLPSIPTGPLSTDQATRQLLGRINTVADLLRSSFPAVSDDDPASGDLINGAVGQLEEQAWMLLAQLPHS